MLSETRYGLRIEVEGGFDDTVQAVTAALKTQGFGVLTTIEIDKALKEKIGAEFRRYTILGACNPHLAYRALTAELELGLLLPCNVIVYETDDRKTVVSAVDPMQTMAAQGDPAMRPLAEQVRQKLQRVIDSL